MSGVLHWVLDVTFREGDSRIRCDNAPASFTTLCRFALNLLKRHTTPRLGARSSEAEVLEDRLRRKLPLQARFSTVKIIQ